jgi:hypothetical protein
VNLRVECLASGELAHETTRALHALCADAYREDLVQYFADIGPGVHLLG